MSELVIWRGLDEWQVEACAIDLPIHRSGLHRRDGTEDFVMAWVSVPDLSVIAYPQRYEHVRDSVVRFVDLGPSKGFTADLELDAAGIVDLYPELAERVGDEPSEPSRRSIASTSSARGSRRSAGPRETLTF